MEHAKRGPSASTTARATPPLPLTAAARRRPRRADRRFSDTTCKFWTAAGQIDASRTAWSSRSTSRNRLRAIRTITYRGGCHCGRVRFELDAPARLEALDCNCSMCCRTGYLHVIVDKQQFRLLAGADALTEYRFNTRVAQHLFCATCGVKSFYVPRSHPYSYSVNARCVEGLELDALTVVPFDGRHWQRAAASL